MTKWASYQPASIFEKWTDDLVFKRPMDYNTFTEEMWEIYESISMDTKKIVDKIQCPFMS